MSVQANIFIGVLEEEVKLWKEAALRCDSVIALLSAERQKIEWIMIAASYRHRAKELEEMIDELRRAEGSR
jgi:hypothetical protein